MDKFYQFIIEQREKHMEERDKRDVPEVGVCSLYIKLRTSPLDTGLEQEYTCSMKRLNASGKVYQFHTARPIEKARTFPTLFLSRTGHERVAL